MMFYEKLTARCWQEESAMHSEWAIDYLLDGQLEKAVRHQRISAEYAENARCAMKHCSLTGSTIEDEQMAETLKHTPGPWKAMKGRYGWQIHTDHRSGKGAANVNHWIANIKCESCPFDEEANANLIAEAPNLLKALRELSDRLGPRWFLEQNWVIPLEAIAKAEGRS